IESNLSYSEGNKMQGQIVGYIRVSTVDQNTERQRIDVKTDRNFTDKVSGKDTNRPALQEMIAYVRAGDTVVVHSLDRLARNLDDLRRLVKELTGKGVIVHFKKESLIFNGEDTSLSTLLMNILGSFAEFQRSLILEAQRE